MPTKVYYNNKEVLGDPFVSRSKTPIDYGDRWGMTESITLNGMIEGLDYYDGATNKYAWQHITEDIFKVNFQEFKVVEDGVDYMVYPSVMIESIDFPQDKWGRGVCYNFGTETPNAFTSKNTCVNNGDTWKEAGIVNYSVKLKAYDVFSNENVIDPSDSYSFTENEDGTVSVTHKISAKGIKTNTSSAFDNAVNFVNTFAGINHFGNCDPYFIQNNEPVFLGKTESIDRLNGSYSLTENYKYQHEIGEGALPTKYIRTSKINLNEDTKADFHTVEWESQYKTDASYGMSNLRTDIKGENIESEISAVINVPINEIFQTNYSVNEDPAKFTIDYKASFVLGMDDAERAKGYFDPSITMTKDEITDITIWTIDGQFVTYGTLEQKQAAIQNFKTTIGENYKLFLHNELEDSQIYKYYRGNNPYGNLDGECTASNYGAYPDDVIKYNLGQPGQAACVGGGMVWTDYKYDNSFASAYGGIWLTSIRVTDNPHKGTLSLNASFTDEDRVTEFLLTDGLNPHLEYKGGAPVSSWLSHKEFRPGGATVNGVASSWSNDGIIEGEIPQSESILEMGYPIKYNVSVTEATNIHKLSPSANVEGVFALQDLNCRTKAKTKISINGTNIGGIGLDSDDLYGYNLLYSAGNSVRRATEYKLLNYYKED